MWLFSDWLLNYFVSLHYLSSVIISSIYVLTFSCFDCVIKLTIYTDIRNENDQIVAYCIPVRMYMGGILVMITPRPQTFHRSHNNLKNPYRIASIFYM